MRLPLGEHWRIEMPPYALSAPMLPPTTCSLSVEIGVSADDVSFEQILRRSHAADGESVAYASSRDVIILTSCWSPCASIAAAALTAQGFTSSLRLLLLEVLPWRLLSEAVEPSLWSLASLPALLLLLPGLLVLRRRGWYL